MLPYAEDKMPLKRTNKIKVIDIKNAVLEAKPRNAEELWKVVKSSWAGVRVYRCQKLIDTYPKRLAAVIAAKGGSTKY
uniref:Uncharacterized protein n=1 Tax=Pundamilia nyererei TaxID=303518 RepID=A0A3B4F735_9CICH